MNQDIFCIIGPAVAFIHLCYFLLKWRRIRTKGYSTMGEIIGFDGTDDDAYPIIRFKTVTGESIEKKYKVSRSTKDKIGDRLPLYYDPDKPIDFYIDKPWHVRIILLMMTGCVLFVIAYFLFFRVKQ